jgi:hypothetical protein
MRWIMKRTRLKPLVGISLMLLTLSWASPGNSQDEKKDVESTKPKKTTDAVESPLGELLGDTVRIGSLLILKFTSDECLDQIEELLKTSNDSELRSQLNRFTELRKFARVFGYDPLKERKSSDPKLLAVSLRTNEQDIEEVIAHLGDAFVAEYASSPVWVASVFFRELWLGKAIYLIDKDKRDSSNLLELRKKAYVLQARFAFTSKKTGDRRIEKLLTAFQKGETSNEWAKYVAEQNSAPYSSAQKNLSENEFTANKREFIEKLQAKYPFLKSLEIEIKD